MKLRLQLYHLFFITVLLTPVVLLFLPLLPLYLAIVTTIGVLTGSGTLKLPYFLDGEKENFKDLDQKPLNTKKDLMFFIHGWPDNKEIWNEQVNFFKENYHCASVDLPHFGENIEGLSRFGYSFEEVAEIIAFSLRRCQAKVGKDKAILVVHDWGSNIGLLIERKYPDLVSKIVAVDVYTENFEISKKELQFAGIYFQYVLILAWLLSVCIPVIGRYFGDRMNQVVQDIFQGMKDKTGIPYYSYYRPHCTKIAGDVGLQASANYMQFYIHLNTYLDFFGMRTPTGSRYKTTESKCPVLFIYNGDAPKIKFYKDSTIERQNSTPECKTISMQSRIEGRKISHWIMADQDASERMNIDIKDWLG